MGYSELLSLDNKGRDLRDSSNATQAVLHPFTRDLVDSCDPLTIGLRTYFVEQDVGRRGIGRRGICSVGRINWQYARVRPDATMSQEVRASMNICPMLSTVENERL